MPGDIRIGTTRVRGDGCDDVEHGLPGRDCDESQVVVERAPASDGERHSLPHDRGPVAGPDRDAELGERRRAHDERNESDGAESLHSPSTPQSRGRVHRRRCRALGRFRRTASVRPRVADEALGLGRQRLRRLLDVDGDGYEAAPSGLLFALFLTLPSLARPRCVVSLYSPLGAGQGFMVGAIFIRSALRGLSEMSRSRFKSMRTSKSETLVAEAGRVRSR